MVEERGSRPKGRLWLSFWFERWGDDESRKIFGACPSVNRGADGLREVRREVREAVREEKEENGDKRKNGGGAGDEDSADELGIVDRRIGGRSAAAPHRNAMENGRLTSQLEDVSDSTTDITTARISPNIVFCAARRISTPIAE